MENYNDIDAYNATTFVASLTHDKSDPKLGSLVKEQLQLLGLEPMQPNPDDSYGPRYAPEDAYAALREGIYQGYKYLGLDVDNDPSIQDTPDRFAKMFVGELTKGLNYDFFPKCTATPNGTPQYKEVPDTQSAIGKFQTKRIKAAPLGAYDQMVLVKRIRTVSLCEHHLQTIDGHTHIAYIPGEKVLGLSKFARVTEFFAARPQIQERMTEQIFHALEFILQTSDIAVQQDAVHFCMRARGAKQPESSTTTSKLGGRFLTNAALREEFYGAVRA